MHTNVCISLQNIADDTASHFFFSKTTVIIFSRTIGQTLCGYNAFDCHCCHHHSVIDSSTLVNNLKDKLKGCMLTTEIKI